MLLVEHSVAAATDMMRILQEGEEMPLSEVDFVGRLEDSKRAVLHKTPGAKKRKINLEEEAEWLSASRIEVKGDGVMEELLRGIQEFIPSLISAISDNHKHALDLSDKLVQVEGIIGDMPGSAPPTLWYGQVALAEQLGAVRDGVEEAQRLVTEANGKLKRDFTADLQGLEERMRLAVQFLESEMERRLKGDMATTTVGGGTFTYAGGPQDMDEALHQADLSNNSNRLDVLERKVVVLGSSVESLVHKGKNNVVTVGSLCFKSERDLLAWSRDNLPCGFPFGDFIDVYSFLERIVSYDSEGSTTVVKDMETRGKVELSTSEALTINSFKRPLPLVFLKNANPTAMVTTHVTFLPGLPTKAHWQDRQKLGGLSVSIKRNIPVVRNQIRRAIQGRLRNHPAALALAEQFLSDTISFVTELMEFISDTCLELETSGFGEQEAWHLVTKLVQRIFTVNFELERSMVRERLDSGDREFLAVGALWATFSTLQIQEEFQQFKIENHPAVASEYVRFLVANSGVARIESLEAKVRNADKAIGDLQREISRIQKIAMQSMNKVDELKRSSK